MKRLFVGAVLAMSVGLYANAANALEVYVGLGGCYTDPLAPLCQEVLAHAGASQELYVSKDEKTKVNIQWDHFSQPSDGFSGRKLGFDFFSINLKYKVW